MRLPVELNRRLTVRVAQDKRATRDYGLAAAHYLNAALSQVPADIQQAAHLGLVWRAAHPSLRATAVGSGSRLHRDVAAAMHDLGSWLKTLDAHPHAWEVMAAALSKFLDQLDSLDETRRR